MPAPEYAIDAIQARNELLARAASEGWRCYFTHDPGRMPVRLEATEKGGYRAV